MSSGRAAPYGLSRMPADCSGRRSNTIHRPIYSRRSDLRRCSVIHIGASSCAHLWMTLASADPADRMAIEAARRAT